MITLPHLMVFLTVSSFMLTVVNLLPALVKHFQEHYLVRISHSSRELEKFFVHVKIPHVLGAALVASGLLGWLTGSWVFAGACAILGLLAPKAVLTIWKNVRSS